MSVEHDLQHPADRVPEPHAGDPFGAVNDAIKRGLTDPTEIAMDALRAEGISASYKVSGEIGYIVIDDDA